MNQAILDDETHRKQKASNPLLYASFGKRTLAAMIDGFIFIPTYMIADHNYESWKSLPLDLLLTIFIPVVYKIIMEWKYGGTIGKILMKLTLVDQQLNPISFTQSLKRFSIYFLTYSFSVISTLAIFGHPEFQQVSGEEMEFLFETDIYWICLASIFFLNLLTVSFVLLTKKKQALHDLIAQTYCVNKINLFNLQEIDEMLNEGSKK